MQNVKLGKTDIMAPRIVPGCMRMKALSDQEAAAFISTAIEAGASFFDHADIYGGGACEEIFARALPLAGYRREDVMLQSKCGIRKGFFDFSKEHILSSVDGILKRLNTEYLDILLLHRPDALMEPEEVAAAFDQLAASGKVRNFGVSNQTSMQIELLQKYLSQKLIINQLQLSITNCGMIRSGITANMERTESADHDGHILDYCRLKEITIQAWSPFQYGMFEGVFLGSGKFPDLNAKLDEIAAKYDVSATTIAAAWILRHPAGMQLISGTMNPVRFKEICQALEIKLSREDWYGIYTAAGNILP